MHDYLIKAFVAEKKILVIIGNTTNLVEESRQRHNTLTTATAALGRALTLVSIMSTTLAENQSLSLQIIGSGPLEEIYCQTDWQGNVRGYVKNPLVDLGLNKQGKINVEAGIGSGMLYLVKDLGLKEPFRGSSELVSGGIARDLAYYFTVSEQKPSAVSAGVYINKNNTVQAAGGFIVQPVLDADEDILIELEQNIRSLPMISSLIKDGVTTESILKMIAQGFDSEIFSKSEIHYKCNCSKAHCFAALSALGKKVIKDMLKKEEQITMQCDFCGEKYDILLYELKQLLDKL